MKTKILALLISLIMPLSGYSAEDISGEFDAVRIIINEMAEEQQSVSNRDISDSEVGNLSQQTNRGTVDRSNRENVGAQDDFTFTYDPAQLADAKPVDISFSDLEKLSVEMESDEFKQKLETEFVIPVSTSAENLKDSKELPPEELKIFISKKTKFLQQISGLFRFVKLTPHYTNKIIMLLNGQLFKKSAVVANANAKVVSIQIGFGGGFGFNDWIMRKLKSSPYFRDLPDTAGFYLLLNTGISFGKVIKNGKTKFFIEPVIEYRRGERFFSPFLYIAGGLTASYTWENRNKAEAIQKAEFYKVSSATIIEGFKHFGFSAAAAAVFPPAGGAISGIEGSVTRIRMTPALLIHFVDVVRGKLRRTLGLKPICAHFFRDGT